jgi:uncharacterized membrane protein YecN with MAPEG domain
MLIITAISASVLTALFLKLALNVISLRTKNKISIGDGGNEDLNRAIRAHGNFAEYTPIALILLACLEFNNCWRLVVLALAIAFIAGRIIHARGIVENESDFKKRILGMKLTFFSLAILAALNLLLVILKIF